MIIKKILKTAILGILLSSSALYANTGGHIVQVDSNQGISYLNQNPQLLMGNVSVESDTIDGSKASACSSQSRALSNAQNELTDALISGNAARISAARAAVGTASSNLANCLRIYYMLK